MGSENDPLKEEAARRFAESLSDRFGADDRRRLNAWLAESPAHVRAFNEARNTWNALKSLEGDAELLALLPQRKPRRQWAIAASLAVVVIGAALWWQLQMNPKAVLHTTQPWEQRTVTLADGSTALLSASTQLEVSTSQGARSAVVHKGEAIFDIITDKSRPFVVTVGDAAVIVTGTRFQVRNEAGRVAVTLVEGEIKLARERFHYQQKLVPGQQIAFAQASEQAEVRQVDVAAVTAWSRDQLVFRDAPLADALREANRHSTLKLILQDPSLASIQVNGHFRLGDTESLLAAVQSSFPIRAQYLNESEVLLTRAQRD